MKYDEAKSKIEDGDVILVKGESGFLTPFTRFFTRSPYTHAGVAFWMNGDLWMAEINGGKNHAIPLSQLSGVESYEVFKRPVEVHPEDVLKSILKALSVMTKYGLAALPVIGLLDFLKLKVFVHWRKILVCSGWTVMILEDAGWSEHSRIVSPADLSEMLELKLTVEK